MFKNIGLKIKKLAIFTTIFEIILFSIYGISCLVKGEILFGIVVIIGGILLSWISSFFVYGFGELIDNTSKIVKKSTSQLTRLSQIASSEYEYIVEDDELVNDNNQNDNDYDDEDEYYDELIDDPENIPNDDECPNCFSKITSRTKKCSNCGYKIR